mgnify:CR=1 FL=1
MGKTTKISWTDSTWSPWRGCHKTSAGCKNCYFFRDAKRYGHDPETVVRSKTTFNDPIKWKEPRKIFVCSWSDFFIEEADEWRDEAWDVMRRAPWHTYQICTKRIYRAEQCLPDDWGDGYKNVWLGVTGENQVMLDFRIHELMRIKSAIHWVSIEPMLEAIELSDWQLEELDWLVVGGESGNGARPFDPHWIDTLLNHRSLFVKQMGSNPIGLELKHPHGADPLEWDARYRIQEFPVVCNKSDL